MTNIYWSGPRESDAAYTDDMFAGSATFYGKNVGNNTAFCSNNDVRINHNLYNQAASNFILNWQLKKIEEDPDCQFMSYNPNFVYGAPDEVVKRTLCLNEPALMEKLENKVFFKQLIEGIAAKLPHRLFLGGNCSYDNLKTQFSNYDSFVLQEPISSGGEGTFLMTLENSEEIISLLRKDSSYIVTGYIEDNIPVNLHAIIFDNNIALFPGSVQIIQLGNNRLLYRGADYCTFLEIAPLIREKLYNQSFDILTRIQNMGYRGIVGVDAMIVGDEVFFTEINNRFQGSSVLLAKALSENNLPSLQKMNLDAFTGKEISDKLLDQLNKISVPYSMYSYINEQECFHAFHIFGVAQNEKRVVEVLSEGFRPDQEFEPYAHLFSVVFTGNITSLSPDKNRVRIHPNVAGPSKDWLAKLLSGDLTALKISLMNRGVVLTDAAKKYVNEHGDMREGTYFSLDIFMRGIYINSPLYVKLTALSPFKLDVNSNQELILTLYDKQISKVTYDRRIDLQTILPHNTLPLDKILFFATDRLRIQNNSYCTFSKHGVVCKFCEANGLDNKFSEQDILDSIDLIFCSANHPMFRHVLIGGLSNEIGFEQDTIIKICKKIRSYSDMPIYLMCLPPLVEDIKRYYDAGVTEFGFNIEVFDREIAKQIMPGKGFIPLKRYMDALTEAVRLCGQHGAVRSAFIVGLEPERSLLQGIEEVCRMGVAPILSVFRPIPATEMEDVIPPLDEQLYELTQTAERICAKYGLSLGPTCPACRNNTLTIVQENEVEAIYSTSWRRSN